MFLDDIFSLSEGQQAGVLQLPEMPYEGQD
jgi:hypothetical protein